MALERDQLYTNEFATDGGTWLWYKISSCQITIIHLQHVSLGTNNQSQMPPDMITNPFSFCCCCLQDIIPSCPFRLTNIIHTVNLYQMKNHPRLQSHFLILILVIVSFVVLNFDSTTLLVLHSQLFSSNLLLIHPFKLRCLLLLPLQLTFLIQHHIFLKPFSSFFELLKHRAPVIIHLFQLHIRLHLHL